MSRRVTIMLRVEEELVTEVINPLKEEGRLSEVLVTALKGYGNDENLKSYLDEGVSADAIWNGKKISEQIDSALASLGDSSMRSERARMLLEDGAGEFSEFSEGLKGREGVGGLEEEVESLKEDVKEILAILKGGSIGFERQGGSQEGSKRQGEVEDAEEFSKEPVLVDIELPEDLVDEWGKSSEKAEKNETTYVRPVFKDSNETEDFNYTPADAVEESKKDGKSMLARLAQGTNMGGL